MGEIVMITLKKEMLYHRYILIVDGSQEIMAIDTSFILGDEKVSTLYLWEMRTPPQRYEVNYRKQLKVIGVDMYD